jgi:threonine aldolase
VQPYHSKGGTKGEFIQLEGTSTLRFIDLRSDTVTVPTQEMREAMFKAEVGDDVYEDDPTVKELEKYAAMITGKEASLFVPSGTFGNQLALFTHCNRGDEVILGDDCHIVLHEVGASSVIAGVHLRTVETDKGVLDPAKVESRIRREDIHCPVTGLIELENAHSNGRVIPLSNMEAIYHVGKKHRIPVHLDGARIFNAAVYLKKDVKEIAAYSDSVMFCLSKGLGAPVGSMLAGTKEFINKARKKRKLMGGGLRQAGFLAAAGLVALEKMPARLKKDHENALLLGKELAKIPGIKVDLEDIHINMVWFRIEGYQNEASLMSGLLEKGIKANPPENGLMRFVTNYGITKEDIIYTAATMRYLLA